MQQAPSIPANLQGLKKDHPKDGLFDRGKIAGG